MINMKGKCSCLADFFLLQEKEGDYCRFNQGEQDCRNCLPRSGFVQPVAPPDTKGLGALGPGELSVMIPKEIRRNGNS